MQAVLLPLLLAGASKGLDSTCDATQDAACYGALEGPVYLQLMRDTTGHDLRLYSGDKNVFTSKSSKTVFYNEFNNLSFIQRGQFVPDNGTLIINPAERRDTGTYRVAIYDESTGKSVGEHTVQLIIEAPVSVVNLSISCSAYGERRVSCSSNGDSPQYRWSVDGRPLRPPEASPSGSTERPESSPDLDTDLSSSTLTLREGIQGHLTCSARNNISNTSETQLLPSCTTTPAPTTTSNVVSMATTTLGPASDSVITPVSDVDLSISCSANGEWRLRCSSNGHSPQYSWYLDGRPLSEADADLSADNQTLLFSGDVTGRLSCSVRNNISSTHTSALLLDACSDISPVFISVWLAEIITLTSLLVGGYYLYIRNKRTQTPDECKDQEVELTPTSMSCRRRRTPEEVQMQ